MDYNYIIKVRFSLNQQVSTIGEKFTETDIEFDDLVKLITDIEECRDGLGKNLHKEAFTGIDYLIWTHKEVIKYNFDEDWVPFNRKIRDIKIDSILK